MMGLFERPQTAGSIRYVSHRGFTPLAPENSLPAFEYAGRLGQWAIETDVHFSRDGVAVCCHNDSVEAMYNGEGLIREMAWSELSILRLRAGNRLECFCEDRRKMPLFAQYLAICKQYGAVPFIELKTGDAGRVVQAVREAGFADDQVIMSAAKLEWLEEARRAAPCMFVHHIFSDERGLARLADMGNAGLSWRVDDPFKRPVELIEKARRAGVRVCLRAADTWQAVCLMLELGLDYLPTNSMHQE